MKTTQCCFCVEDSSGPLCFKCLKKEQKRIDTQNSRAKKKGILTRLSIRDWVEVLENFSFCCPKCFVGFSRQNLTIDHIVSMKLGGENNKYNIQPLCSSCHEVKAMVETKMAGNKKKRLEAKEIINNEILY